MPDQERAICSIHLFFFVDEPEEREKAYRARARACVNIREKKISFFLRTSSYNSFSSHSFAFSFLLAYSLFFLFLYFMIFFIFLVKPVSLDPPRELWLGSYKIKSLEYLASPRNYRRKNPISVVVISRVTCLSCHITFAYKIVGILCNK